MMVVETKLNKTSMLVYLFILTGFFLLLEFSFFVQCNRTYLGDFQFVTDKIHIPYAILPGVFYFVFIQLSLHIAFTILIWINYLSISYLIKIPEKKQFSLALGIWTIGILFVLVSNQYFLPNSKFAELTGLVLRNDSMTQIAFVVMSSLVEFSLLMAFGGGVKWLYSRVHRHCKRSEVIQSDAKLLRYARNDGSIHHQDLHDRGDDYEKCSVYRAHSNGIFRTRKHFVLYAAMTITLITMLITHSKQNRAQLAVNTNSQPNVILIGVDSLRPDYLSFFGHDAATPFMDDFLSNSTVFAEAVTPLARTFPSWTGIFTGQYPRENQIRFNLAQQLNVNLENALGKIFQRHGYETLFATDETRFSNIDKNFGFDRIISPPMGLNDFLIGTFNDFPLSNLIINSYIGPWLFPYSYANRPVFFAYDPDSFIRLLNPVVKQPHNKPLFMAVHFCLPHYPYLWRDLPGNDYNPWERYSASIIRVDQQIRDFYTLLKDQHLLDHAIVVLLSDHGEALELPGDRITEDTAFISKTHTHPPHFYPPSLDDENVNQSGGHGTDVLGIPQYHSLLAFRLIGLGQQNVQVLPGIVSLLDIKPTLLDLLNFKAPPASGISLAANIKGIQAHRLDRHIFLESDFSPAAIRTVYPQAEKVLLDGVELFQVDPKSTRLTVKKSMGQMIIESKQYADIYQNWMLALYPQNSHFRMPILINLRTGEWTNDLNNSFAQRSPAKLMLQKLQSFYGSDLSLT